MLSVFQMTTGVAETIRVLTTVPMGIGGVVAMTTLHPTKTTATAGGE